MLKSGNIRNDNNTTSVGDNIVSLADGTVTNPSIKFYSDSDTGIYKYGSGTIGFASNGAVSGYLSSAGVVFTGSAKASSFVTESDNAQTIFLNKNNGNRRASLGIFGTESGGDTGNNFTIAVYDDAGAFLDNVLVISRTNYQLTTKASITTISTSDSSYGGNINMNGKSIINSELGVTTFAGTSGTLNNREGKVTFTNSSSLAQGAFQNYTVNNTYATVTNVLGVLIDSNDTNSFNFTLYRTISSGGVISFGVINNGPATSTSWTITLYFKLFTST
jgi:hypothetical protein